MGDAMPSLGELKKVSEWLSSIYKVKPPRIEVTEKIPTVGLYIPATKTVYIRPDALYDEKLARKVILHETAHHIDAMKGFADTELQSEIFAHAFESYAYHPYSDTESSIASMIFGALLSVALANLLKNHATLKNMVNTML